MQIRLTTRAAPSLAAPAGNPAAPDPYGRDTAAVIAKLPGHLKFKRLRTLRSRVFNVLLGRTFAAAESPHSSLLRQPR